MCTEAGMFAIRARRKSASEKDFLDSINKVGEPIYHFLYQMLVANINITIQVIKGYQKFSSTPKYMVYN